MALFGRGKVEAPDTAERLSRLEAEVSRLASALRLLEVEQGTVHDQVRKWMRRAVAAERAAERNQEPDGAEPPAPPVMPRVITGVRARRMARLARRDPMADANGGTDGVHS